MARMTQPTPTHPLQSQGDIAMVSMTPQAALSPLRPTRRMPVPMVQRRRALLLLLTIGLVTAGIVGVAAQQQSAARSAPAAAPIIDAPAGYEQYLQLRRWPARDGSAYGMPSTETIGDVPATDVQLRLIGSQPHAPLPATPAVEAPAGYEYYLQVRGWLSGTVWESTAEEG